MVRAIAPQRFDIDQDLAAFREIVPPRGGAFRLVIANWEPLRGMLRKRCREYSEHAWRAAMKLYMQRQSSPGGDALPTLDGQLYAELVSRLLCLDEGRVARPLRELLPHDRQKGMTWSFGGFEVRFNEAGRGLVARSYRPIQQWGLNPLHDAFWVTLATTAWTPQSGGEVHYERHSEIVRIEVGYGQWNQLRLMRREGGLAEVTVQTSAGDQQASGLLGG